MRKLGSFVGRTIRSLKADQAVKLHQLKSIWLQAVGPFLSSQTEPVKVQNRILYLKVSTSVWAQEINLQQRMILDRLRRKMPNPPRRIVCWVGEVHVAKEKWTDKDDSDSSDLVPWKDIPIPDDRQARIEETVSTITSPKLQKRMRQLLELSVRREIYLLAQGELPCPICGNFRPSDEPFCSQCERDRKAEYERTLLRLLANKPWLSAEEATEQVPLQSRASFLRARKSLLADWMLQAWQLTDSMDSDQIKKSMNPKLRALLLDITMLRCSLPVHSLQNKHFYFALGKRIAEGYVDS